MKPGEYTRWRFIGIQIGSLVSAAISATGKTSGRTYPDFAIFNNALTATIGIDRGIEEIVLDAICGHAPLTQGRKYSRVALKKKSEAMKKFPRYPIEPA